MAANSNAIGLVFEVDGQGSIGSQTYLNINTQLQSLVSQINSSGILQLQFSIDINRFQQELDLLKQTVKNMGQVSPSGGGNPFIPSQAYQKASESMKDYFKMQSQIEKAMTRTRDIINNNGIYSTNNSRWAPLVDQMNDATNRMNAFNSSAAKANMSLDEQQRLSTQLAQSNMNLNAQIQNYTSTAESSYGKLQAKVQDYIGRVEQSASRDEVAKQKLSELRDMANNNDFRGYDELNKKLIDTQRYINQNNLATKTWAQTLKEGLGNALRSILTGLFTRAIVKTFRQLYTNVKEIDSAMTQLKIVTKATDKQMTAFLTNSIELAKSLGSQTKDVLGSVETFSRLGYNLEDATALSKYATILAKTANVTSEEATKGLTSIVKGFGFNVSDAEHISDVLIQVGQKYAVSASELMTAYERAGSALNATNTSFEKSAGLIAAANAPIQNASIVGTALKTVSARIRKSKTELEELGEDTSDLASSFSVHAEEIKALTGFDIIKEGTVDKFKDLYDIFDGISKTWDKLGDTEQARVAEILGGTRQLQVISAIISNWKDSVNAYTDAMDSAGTATTAIETYMDSIEGRMGQLQATFEELSLTVLSSDVVKVGVDILRMIVDIVNAIATGIDKVIGLKNAIAIAAGVFGTLKLHEAVKQIKEANGFISNFATAFKLAREQGEKFGKSVSMAFDDATMSAEGFQVALAAITAIISALVIAYNIYDRARQDSINGSIEASRKAQEASKEAKETANSIRKLADEYKDAKIKGNFEDIERIQEEVVGLVGDQAAGIDLVNGKLIDQIGILKDIEDKNRDIARDDAELALAKAKIAARDKMYGFELGSYYAYGLDASKYGVEIAQYQTAAYLKTSFDTVEELIEQYEDVKKYNDYIAGVIANSEPAQGVVAQLDEKAMNRAYEASQKFLKDYKDVYEGYINAIDLLKLLDKKDDDVFDGVTDSTYGATVALKNVKTILDEVGDRYDYLVSAGEDMDKYGVLSAKTLSTLLDKYPDLIGYLEQTANGYVLNANALQLYITGLIDAAIAEINLTAAGTENRKIAIQNLKNLQAVLSTLAVTTNDTKAAEEKQKDVLNDQKEALKDQADAYKKLIDLRKKLLEQYKDEIDYKKELAKKENNVSKLQAQYTVSLLDTSAAGRARTRQLAEDLKEAQEELDDFTLEHAIDVITDELDDQYDEYQNWIDGKLSEIEDAINALGESSSIYSTQFQSAIEKMKEWVEELINNYERTEMKYRPHVIRDMAGRLIDNQNYAYDLDGKITSDIVSSGDVDKSLINSSKDVSIIKTVVSQIEVYTRNIFDKMAAFTSHTNGQIGSSSSGYDSNPARSAYQHPSGMW